MQCFEEFTEFLAELLVFNGINVNYCLVAVAGFAGSWAGNDVYDLINAFESDGAGFSSDRILRGAARSFILPAIFNGEQVEMFVLWLNGIISYAIWVGDSIRFLNNYPSSTSTPK